MRFRTKGAVNLLLLRGTSFFLLRRYNTGWKDGIYSPIAGHLDGDESAQEAIIREASEEAGIVVPARYLVPMTVIHSNDNVDEYIDFWFLAYRWYGEPVLNEQDKCNGVGWFEKDALPENTLHYVPVALDAFRRKQAFVFYGWRN